MVTSFGPSQSVDQAVRAIVTSYDGLGRVECVTSRGGADADQNGLPDDVLNQVKYVYNGWGQVFQEYQARRGTTTPAGVG